jgi:transcription elongation GreA/GreB family factor
MATFSLFEQEEKGRHLGIAPLGSGIFAPSALGIISRQMLDNETLLKVLRWLVTFENTQGHLVRVNYADLDVEEFGSVYEGLLEYDPEITESAGQPEFGFVKGDGRSSSGSHYTPEELVQPLIKHSLDYLIEDKLKEAEPEKGLLSLSICDVACGSGHILLSAARRVGFELAKVRSKEDQPTPSVLRVAVRDVIRSCIYGVDLNPLAVELCKVALWLEAHEPGEPLNFLDHHIKCGNAIVGLANRSELENGIADEAFKTLPGDDATIAKTWRDKNSKERKERAAKALQLKAAFEKSTKNSANEAMTEYLAFSRLPESTPEEIESKTKAYQNFIGGQGYSFLKAMADTQVAQFFISKTAANKDCPMSDADFREILSGYKGWQLPQTAMAKAMAADRHFFHWFLEFPEVFQKGGFDCILGNPPYLGGKKLSGSYGSDYLNWIITNYSPAGGQADLIVYFLKRIFNIISNYGILSIITTNTISQGDTREFGLNILLDDNGIINFAYPSIKWPGKANLEVTIISICKIVNVRHKIFFKNKEVKYINSFLEPDGDTFNPFKLKENANKSFKGSYIGGLGYTLVEKEKAELIFKNEINHQVIFPYITGGDLNEDYLQRNSRWVINFFNWPIEKAMKYEDCFEIIRTKVKPEREKANRISNREKWWIYAEDRPGLYSAISRKKCVLGISQVTKHLIFEFLPKGVVYDTSMIIFPFESNVAITFLQNTIHDCWARKYGSTLESRLRYTPTDCFETYPFPQNLNTQLEQHLETIGETYHEHRRQLMLGMQLGLTKTYNLFHSNAITVLAVNEKDKQMASLQKHLEKTTDTIPFHEAIQGILKLRELHVRMDEAVLEAYGWQDMIHNNYTAIPNAQGEISTQLHDFYEVDYLPENDRVRFAIHPDARKEVLKRLLELNHKIHAEEVAAGLWEKKGAAAKKKPQSAKTSIEYGETEHETPLVKEASQPYLAKEAAEGSVLTLLSHDHKEIRVSLGKSNVNVMSISPDSPFGKALLGRKTGDYVAFGKGFKIERVE